MKKIQQCLFQIINYSLLLSGFFSLIIIILSFTSLPYWTRYWLGTVQSEYHFKPDYIIMLGGSGMPSEDNLIRLYYTAEMAKKYDNAEIILLHPMDSTVNFKMKRELTGKGINKNRIMFEFHGTNTRSQAMSLALHYPKTLNSNIVIVSSTEHILRAVMTFRKAGFKNVGACPALEYDMNTDFRFNSKKLGGKSYIPDMGNSIKLRYNFWSYLKLEIICLREFSALGYYSLNGWI